MQKIWKNNKIYSCPKHENNKDICALYECTGRYRKIFHKDNLIINKDKDKIEKEKTYDYIN